MEHRGPYFCFCLDEAVGVFGSFVTNELDKITGKTDKEVNRKRHVKLMQLTDQPDSKRFRKVNKPK